MYCRMHVGCMPAKTKNLAMQNIARFPYFNGAGDMNRTRDLLITNELLYRLSYTGVSLRLYR